MSLRFYHAHTTKAATEKAMNFCGDFNSWLEASYVRDTTALDKLSAMFKETAPSLDREKDQFEILFTGDYDKIVTSEDLWEELLEEEGE